MPNITQDVLTTSATPGRRSARKTKVPSNYNPSDDSDEEYVGTPAGKTTNKDKARSQRKRKYEKEEEKPNVASTSKKTREDSTETFQSGDMCPLCNERELIFEGDEAKYNYMGIKYHIVFHYLRDTNRFSEEKILIPTDPVQVSRLRWRQKIHGLHGDGDALRYTTPGAEESTIYG